jgi:hypothetical protein
MSHENFDHIYKDKKNLPPMKRFKIFHHLNNMNDNDEKNAFASSGASIVDSNEEKDRNNVSNHQYDKTSETKPSNATEEVNSKLLGLAHIALQRETK